MRAKLPDMYWEEGRKYIAYPDLTSLYEYGIMNPTSIGMVKDALDDDDYMLANNLAHAPGRNPPICQTDYVAPEEQEKPYWPFINTEYLPFSFRDNHAWYENIWGEYGQAA